MLGEKEFICGFVEVVSHTYLIKNNRVREICLRTSEGMMPTSIEECQLTECFKMCTINQGTESSKQLIEFYQLSP